MAVNQDLVSAVNTSLVKKTAAGSTYAAVGDVSPKKGRGKPVQTSAASAVGSPLQPQYAALREDVAADHPIMELSPAVKDMMAKAGQVTSDMLSGVISPDVEAQVRRISAESAIRGGLGLGSPASRNLTARDLGRTSADLQMQGVEAAKALGEFDANWQGQRMSFLQSMRGMDLDAKRMKMEDHQFRKTLDLNRLKLLSDVTSNYYNLAFNYESKKNASQGNLNSLRGDLKKTVAGTLMQRLGLGKGGK
jgi:hypothetical protein